MKKAMDQFDEIKTWHSDQLDQINQPVKLYKYSLADDKQYEFSKLTPTDVEYFEDKRDAMAALNK